MSWETEKLSSLTNHIVSEADDWAKLAAIFANLELLGPSDFASLTNDEGEPLPLTRFLLELNKVTGDDEWLVEFCETDPESARDMAGPADMYMSRVRQVFSTVSLKDQHEWASGYSADIANNLSDKSLGQAFLIVARSAFHDRQMNDLQSDLLDTVQFAWA